jgi:hypothetical protein
MDARPQVIVLPSQLAMPVVLFISGVKMIFPAHRQNALKCKLKKSSGTLATFDIERRTFDIGISRY